MNAIYELSQPTAPLPAKVCGCGLVQMAGGQWVLPAVRYVGSNALCPVCVKNYMEQLKQFFPLNHSQTEEGDL